MAEIHFNWDGTVAQFFEMASPELLSALRDEAPYHEESDHGHFRDTIRVDPHGDRLEARAVGPLATYIVKGTKPHPIDAHGDYSLHNHETDEYFGPHVHHPGTDPNDFPRRALARVKDTLRLQFREAVHNNLTIG